MVPGSTWSEILGFENDSRKMVVEVLQLGFAAEELAMGIEGMAVASDSGTRHLIAHIAPFDFLSGGEDERMEYLEGDVVVATELLSHGIEGVGEVVDEDRGEVEILTLFESGAIDMGGNHPHNLGNSIFGENIGAFDTEGEFGIFKGDITHKGLRRPYDAIAAAARLKHIHGRCARSVEDHGAFEVEALGHLRERIVGNGYDEKVGSLTNVVEGGDGFSLDTRSKEAGMFGTTRPYLLNLMATIVHGQSEVCGNVARSDE